MYRSPNAGEGQASQLVGQQVEIYWDGDDAFYSGRVLSYDTEKALHLILYFDGVTQQEDLSATPWRLYDASVFEQKPPRTQNAEDTRLRRAKALRAEQELLLEKLRKKRDFYLASHLSVLKPFLIKSPYYSLLKRTKMLLPLGDPLLCSTDIDEGVVPLCVSGSENLQKLIAAGVVPADVAAYLNMNPSAVTLDGGYMSCSVMPPLHMTKCNGLEIPSLLSKDAMCVGHTIVFEEHSGCYQTILLDAVENKEGSIEHGNFAGYVIVWPGCRLSPTVTYDQWGSFLESVDSGSVELDASHVYYLEKRLACNSVLDNKTLRLTALRLSTGAFMPISREMLAYTMTYATYSTTPVSNLVAIKYWCPHEGITKTISRQYCDSRYYQKLFNRLLKLFKKAHCDIGYPINRGFNLSAEIVRSKEIVKRHIYSTSLPAEITRQSAVREYHLKVARWMRNSYKNGCPMILRDTSGQGKELEVAAFVASVFKSGDDSRTKFRGPFLIVCSQVSFSRWEAALKLFIPSTRYVCFCGSRINIVKQKKIWAAKQAYCAITSFDELEHERSFFVSNCYWNCVIVDQTADAVATVKCHAAKNNIPRVPCMVLLSHNYANDRQSNINLWSDLNLVAPDIFTQSTLPAFEDFTHEEGGAAASMPSLVYATSDEHINSGFEIIDINIYVPLSLPQLSSYLSIKQSLATSQQGEQQLILQKKLDNMCSALYPNPFILGGDNATGHDSEKHSSLHDALLHNSSKMYLLDKMLSSLEDDGRTVLIMCHSEDIYSILEEYCVLSEKKFMRVRSANAVVQKLDALYLNSVSKDVFVYLLVVDDCEPGVDFDVPAVDTVLIFDSYSTNIEKHILRLINNIRRCNPLVIYKLFSDLAEDHILPKFPFMCDSRDNKSEYEIFSADTGICSADISILMSVKEDVQSVDSKSVATSTWIRSKLPGDVKLRQLFSRLKGVFVDRSKVKSTSIDSKTSLVPRSWLNLPFCCLCGSHELPYGQKCIENKYNTQRLMNCKLCPRSFHRKCFEDSSLPQKELVLVENVCPQHVCACGANAGVMCPCAHCLTVFCERCVPLRDVEPLGRRTEITKECDFYCQTYYYICCDYCAQVRNSEYLNESDRSSIGFYFLSEKESKQKVAAGEQAAPNGLCVREKLIILPTQLTVCHNTEAEFSKKRKREIEECPLVEDYSSDGGKSDYDEEVSVDTIPGSMGFYVSLTVDEKIIYALNKKSTDSNLAMQFIDIILSGDESHAVYADPKKYSLAVSAYVSKNNKDDTKINCSAYDEVIGALYLGYKYICFDVISIAAPVKRSKMRS